MASLDLTWIEITIVTTIEHNDFLLQGDGELQCGILRALIYDHPKAKRETEIYTVSLLAPRLRWVVGLGRAKGAWDVPG